MKAFALFWHKYRVLLRVEWAVMFAYRSESLIWMIGAFIQPLVSMAVWLSISDNQTVGGYDAHDYMVYFLGVLLVDRLTSTWDVWELDASIQDGSLSTKLVRPFHPVHWSISQNLVYKLFFAFLLIPAWTIAAACFPMLRLIISLEIMVLFFIAIVLSSAIRFLIGYEFGLLAFWTNRATAIYSLYEGIHLFLAGRIAPLSMFPSWVEDAATWLPFYVTVGFPVELLTGKIEAGSSAVLHYLMIQLGWVIILAGVFRLLWRSGIKKYGAVGG
ncbi:ABC transporter permease [Paenibacillus sp. GCM10023248]|uniref:ABC transporter permease n=1 Tax=Bacillales TaxID=1385 RepID=UPI002379B5FA|nr:MULTISPECIES: ABC-2 family transporter protein [Bacillales]MDD9265653.1 ABC-2 family transporter protein [Paenibacillus sp. MAHUQ-63]MDR6878893.1 ABC-2 type transport system permease protein [Bacillus sp. 3255]